MILMIITISIQKEEKDLNYSVYKMNCLLYQKIKIN